MSKFFDKLVDRFFDFFNFGRLLTIFIPGLVAALCFSMFLSQLIFTPISVSEETFVKQQVPVPSGEAAAKKDGAQTTQRKGKDVNLPSANKSKKQPAKQLRDGQEISQEKSSKVTIDEHKVNMLKVQNTFSKQIQVDFARVKDNLPLIVILAIVLGFMIYEVGYWILDKMVRSDKLAEYKLYPYSDDNDPDKNLYKFNKTTTDDSSVGIMYFVAHPVPWTQDKTYAATFN